MEGVSASHAMLPVGEKHYLLAPNMLEQLSDKPL